MRSRLSSPALRVALACAAAACVAVPSFAASAKPRRAEAGVPAVADFRLSAPRVRAGDAPALRFSWRVRHPRTLALVLARWDDAGGWLPVTTYVAGRYRDGTSPDSLVASRSFGQLAAPPAPGRWRATLWASVGESDGGPGSVKSALDFEILP